MNKNLFCLFFWLCAFQGFGQIDTIANQRLEEVVVVAKRPTVEMKPGRMSYLISAPSLRSQGRIYDVLNNLPGVMANDDGTIYLNGQSGTQIWIDGKPSYLSGQDLSNWLKSMPTSVLDRVDLLTSPSARYDASGNSGIIHLRLRKISRKGLDLGVDGDFSQGKYGRGFASATLRSRVNKLNCDLAYSHFRETDYDDLSVERNYMADWLVGKSDGRMEQYSYRKMKSHSNYFRIGLDYELSDKMTIGFSTEGHLSDNHVDGDMDSFFQKPFEEMTSSLRTLNIQDRSQDNFSATASLTRRFDASDKRTLELAFDYLRYRYEENQLQLARDTLLGDMEGGIHLYVGRADFTWAFSDMLSLQAGGKSSFVSIDNDAIYTRWMEGLWLPYAPLSCGFRYDENINAGYVRLEAKLGLWNLEAGLRLENTHVKGTQTDGGPRIDSSFMKRYTHLFPTFSAQREVGNGDYIALSYGRRIVRPNYRDLNPFVYIHDAYTYDKGNTLLRPELSDNLELSYWRGNLFKASLSFNYTSDVIIKSYLDQGDYVVYVSPENLFSQLGVGLMFSASRLPLTSFWNIGLNASLIYGRYRLPDNYPERVNKRWTPNLWFSNQLSFPRDWSVEVTGMYHGKMAAGQAVIYPMWTMNLSVRKEFWNGKGSIRLFARDIFHTDLMRSCISTPFQRAFLKERNGQTQVGVSFSYRFHWGLEVKDFRYRRDAGTDKRINL